MAIVINPSSGSLVGKVGDTIYYASDGRKLARTAYNSSNFGKSASRTNAQQTRRVRWANLVNFYKTSKAWMPKAFENRKKGVSDYNKLVALNSNNSTCAFTKEQAAAGACVVEPWLVSQGSLYPVSWERSDGNFFFSNISFSGDIQNDNVADFSATLISENSFLSYGMQLSFVYYTQVVDPYGIPRVRCNYWEVTLSASNGKSISDYLPSSVLVGVSSGSDTFLGVDTSAYGAGAFALIISDTRSGKLLVSSQRLINNNANVILQFSSSDQLTAAINSYGVDTDVFLTPGGNVSESQEPQGSITSFSIFGTEYAGGTNYPTSTGSTTSLVINSSKAITSITSVVLRGSRSNGVTLEYSVPASAAFSISGSTATLNPATFTPTMGSGVRIFRLAATINGESIALGGSLPPVLPAEGE